MRRASLPAGLLAVLCFLGAAAAASAAESFTFTLKSGHGKLGGQDTTVWVQGAPFPYEAPGYQSSGLPLEHPFVVAPFAVWGDVDGASWLSPAADGLGSPEGYEYFVPFYIPAGSFSVSLDAVWRADDAGYLAINGRHYSVRATYVKYIPPSEFHGDITNLVTAGTNRLSFFVLNSRTGVNPTGLAFTADITFTLPDAAAP